MTVTITYNCVSCGHKFNIMVTEVRPPIDFNPTACPKCCWVVSRYKVYDLADDAARCANEYQAEAAKEMRKT